MTRRPELSISTERAAVLATTGQIASNLASVLHTSTRGGVLVAQKRSRFSAVDGQTKISNLLKINSLSYLLLSHNLPILIYPRPVFFVRNINFSS